MGSLGQDDESKARFFAVIAVEINSTIEHLAPLFAASPRHPASVQSSNWRELASILDAVFPRGIRGSPDGLPKSFEDKVIRSCDL